MIVVYKQKVKLVFQSQQKKEVYIVNAKQEKKQENGLQQWEIIKKQIDVCT